MRALVLQLLSSVTQTQPPERALLLSPVAAVQVVVYPMLGAAPLAFGASGGLKATTYRRDSQSRGAHFL